MSVALFTNNPHMQVLFKEQHWLIFTQSSLQVVQAVITKAEASTQVCVFFDADALPVVTLARDLIHQGWELLNHPLYGNFKPNQQPYRTLLLKAPKVGENKVHVASLELIEEALLVYGSSSVLCPKKAPVSLTAAYSVLDCELMRLSLEQVGFVPSGSVFFNGEVTHNSCAQKQTEKRA